MAGSARPIRPIVIACQNFKGGVGKSTTCVNFAHYLALKGYRVLVIDTDSQATTTSMFGYMPDAEITQEHTLLPYLDSTRIDAWCMRCARPIGRISI